MTKIIPIPEVIEFWTHHEWDSACADMDEQGDWAVSHPFINPRGASPLDSHLSANPAARSSQAPAAVHILRPTRLTTGVGGV